MAQTDWEANKYKVVKVHHTFIEEFEEQVRDLLNDGWALHGGLKVDGRFMFQALIKQGIL